MIYRVFEGADRFYLVLGPEGDRPSEVVGLRRTQQPPKSLADIFEFQPPVSVSSIEESCRLAAEACLVIGLVRFLGHYSLVLCTRREPVGSIASRVVYNVAATQTLLIAPPARKESGFLLDMLFRVNSRLSSDLARLGREEVRLAVPDRRPDQGLLLLSRIQPHQDPAEQRPCRLRS